MGFLADATPTEEFGILVESQTDLSDLYFDETQLEKQTQETIACQSKRTLAKTNLSQCNLEYGFYARHFGKRKKREKSEYHG